MSLLSRMFSSIVLMLMVGALFVPSNVNAHPSRGVVYIADSVHTGDWGLFSTSFIGLQLNSANLAVVVFQAGDWATAEYVVSTDMRHQTEPFFENAVEMKFLSAGTWWFYLAIVGSTLNWDYIQVRIVDQSWGDAEITPKFVNPPFTWREGYPPYGVPFTDGATGADGAVATLPSPTFTSIPSHPTHRPSKSITVWLAPLLVGIIMIAITVPIVIFAYKKGKQNSKPTQVESEVAMEIKEQQQCDQANRIQV